MNLKMLVIILAGAAVVGGFGAIPAAWSNAGPAKIIPCSLDGVNPALHPKIFRHAKVSKSYGFVKGPDGAWQVAPDCHK
jgi:hypothetical protein